MSKDKSRKHDRKGRVDTAELRDALLACCDAAGLVGTSAVPREDSKKAARRRRRPAPSPVPTELRVLIWMAVLWAAWLALVWGLQAANARPAETGAAITADVCLAHARADGWDL